MGGTSTSSTNRQRTEQGGAASADSSSLTKLRVRASTGVSSRSIAFTAGAPSRAERSRPRNVNRAPRSLTICSRAIAPDQAIVFAVVLYFGGPEHCSSVRETAPRLGRAGLQDRDGAAQEDEEGTTCSPLSRGTRRSEEEDGEEPPDRAFREAKVIQIRARGAQPTDRMPEPAIARRPSRMPPVHRGNRPTPLDESLVGGGSRSARESRRPR